MLATGKLSAESGDGKTLAKQDLSGIGFEFSGLTDSGERVMGMVNTGALATTIVSNNNAFIWKVS